MGSARNSCLGKQIYGAERWLRSASHVLRADGSEGLPLPPADKMNIHRVAVAFGSKAHAPIRSMDFGKGFAHVFDDKAFEIILGELDTASDLFSYLNAKAAFVSGGPRVLLDGGEEDLLAVYLANGCVFPSATGIVLVGSGIWDDFSARPEYIAKKKADEVSYLWDKLIDEVAGHALSGTLEFGPSLTDTELALRVMASEDRYQRRLLAKAFDDFLRQSATSMRSRLAVSTSGTTYVFLATPHGADRRDRGVELMARCWAARGRFPANATVVGIATEQYQQGRGHSLDLFCMVKPAWTAEDQGALDVLLSTAPFFKGEMRLAFDEPEYPS